MRNYHIAKDHILQAMPGTQRELVIKSGYCRSTICRWVKKLHDAGECHIHAWQPPRGSGQASAVFKAGAGMDAPCDHLPQDGSVAWKIKKERYGMELLRRQERARHWARKARQEGTTDPLMRAFFGR